MLRLPDMQMLEVLRFALHVNEAHRAEGACLVDLPDSLHGLLKADHSIFCLTSGSATQLKQLIRRIDRATPLQTRRWSNDACVVRSYALEAASRSDVGHGIITVGRNHPFNQIICGMFGRHRKNNAFSIPDFVMSHLAVGYALDTVGSGTGIQSVEIEVTDRAQRRLPGGGASLSVRIDRFLSDMQ